MTGLRDKTILVTGGTGFVGAHLVRRLRAEGCSPVILLARQPQIDNGGYKVVECGLENLAPSVWRDSGVDTVHVVFHLGAFTPTTHKDANLAPEIYKANIDGTRCLIESLPAGVERIIFASTLDVYAPAPGQVISETSPIGPRSLYGASKFFSEAAIQFAARDRGWKSIVLRYGHLYGPGEEAYRKLIPHLLEQMLRGESPTIYGDGSAKVDLLYVEDAVEATLRAAQIALNDHETINVVRGKSESVRQAAELLARLTEYQGEIQYLTDKPAGPSFQFNNRRMRDLLGIGSLVSLEDGLMQEVEYRLTRRTASW